ncbi:MAG: hypothetical protein QOJ65_1405 [Fimbriimonadaceae bacterium]|jgi:hypothetical protein|nr:hypothetical protein [Fimbriimonadaceae bacterium]
MTAAGAAQKTEEAAQKAQPWLEPLARFGYVAKGFIYGQIGMLALMPAVGRQGKFVNQKGAIQTVAQMQFGAVILYAIAIGLAAYSTWRLLMAIFNPEGKKPFKRIGYGITALAYYALGFAALQAAMHQSKGSNGGMQKWAGLVDTPWGRALAVAIGLGLIALAIGQSINAFKSKFMDNLDKTSMDEKERKLATVSGKLGLWARAVVFLLTGGFLIRAGLDASPREAGGMSKALQTLAAAPYGRFLLGAVAFGLVAYAVFQFVEARYRRIRAA